LEEIQQEYHLWKYGGEPPFQKIKTITRGDGKVIRKWDEVEPSVDSER
jgi:hypothetical protein